MNVFEGFLILFLTIMLFCIGVVSGEGIGYNRGIKETRQQAISNGVAYYNPTNAEFIWRTNK